MKPHATATLAAALCLSSIAYSQATTPADDPANLRGERPTPINGLELPIDQGSAGLQQALLRLRTRASLMMIVAHPDDEDGGMLTFEARGHGVRAATLTLTRGEGGQNLMTADFNDALGLIRTQELLAADRYFGTQQYFGTEVDFGFSKTREEALSQWTHDRVLYDAVRAVRLFRPLVITSVFTGNPTDGHGHHQVSGQIAQEVFTAAADPTVFPEMNLPPWAPLKVYARVPFAQASNDRIFDYATQQWVPVRFYNYVAKKWADSVPRPDVLIHEGDHSDALGMSFVQFARHGLALQKSQIGAGMRIPPAGAVDIGYTRYGSRLPYIPGTGPQSGEEQSFFDGIDTSLPGLATLAPSAPPFLREDLTHLDAQFAQAASTLQPAHPEAIAPLLAEALQRLDTLITRIHSTPLKDPQKHDLLHELRIKQCQLQTALALSLGITLDASSPNPDVIAGSQVTVHTTLSTAQPVAIKRLWLDNARGASTDPDPAAHDELTAAHPLSHTLTAKPAFTSHITRPYFSRDNIEQPFYTVHIPEFRSAPSTPAALTAYATLSFRGVDFTIARIVHDGAQPLAFIPPVSLTLPMHAQVLPPNTTTIRIPVNVLTETASVPHGALQLKSSSKWAVHPPESPLATGAPVFTLQAPASPAPATFTASATIAQHSYTEGFRSVGYPGLTRTNFFTEATDRIVPVDVHVATGLRIAYLPGTGDEVQTTLASIGVRSTTLTVADITPAKLATYHVLILGVRAFTAQPGLAAANPAILDFARNGGTVLVQYQGSAYDHDLAPFAFHLGGNGQTVTEESAPVTLTASPAGDPFHLLSTPNRITAEDFKGWVEERGHGFPASFGPSKETPEIEAPTETHDQGQDPQRGGLIAAHIGRGYYIYTAFALYRQLPEAVPGAYRLFANLLSLGHTQ